ITRILWLPQAMYRSPDKRESSHPSTDASAPIEVARASSTGDCGSNSDNSGGIMPNRDRAKPFVLAAMLSLAIVAGSSAWFYWKPEAAPQKAKSKNLPYWQRTGFLSKTMQALHAEGAKGFESIELPEGFEVVPAVKTGLVTYPMFITFDDRGRLFVCESA